MDHKMIDLKSSNLVVVDVETSGTNPFIHELLAVGLAPVVESAPPLLVHVRAHRIEWGEYAKRNFSKFEATWDADAISPQDACAEIESYLRRVFGSKTATPVGHNIGFDTAFLRRLAFRGGINELPGLSHRSLDTHTMLYLLHLKGIIPASALTSDGALRHFGIAVPDEARHTALGDALATRELVMHIFSEFASLEQAEPPQNYKIRR
jgi:DNA polymerase-3 subunit epsilon